MSERIDHAELAGNAIGKALVRAENEEATSITYAMVAQARATLALVEQQRVANLIAIGTARIAPNQVPPLRSLVFEAMNEHDLRPTEPIREALQ